ncbi:MAG: lysyl oxidase family protein [Nannocystaceae bacterium]
MVGRPRQRNRAPLRSRAGLGALALVGACADVPAPGNETTAGSADTTATTWPVTTTASSDGSDGSSSSATGGDDGLPPAPLLQSPADGATEVPIETALCWQPVTDPDGDAVRYRVFVDGIELAEGIQGDQPGYEGPCTPPLSLAFEHTFGWQVQAFEADDPQRQGEPSAMWSFTTIADGDSHVVFEDRFEDPSDWQVGGDAVAGAWVRGNPVPTFDGTAVAQPDRCAGGDACWFTGQNPDADPELDDVDGGATTLTSPPFDLSRAAAGAVQLQRHVYKGLADASAALTVELLVPDVDAPDGYAAHVLESITAATTDDPQHRWTPREYVLCGVPLVDDSRLRITARDDGGGIVEAAIDTVRVIAHDEATICSTGEGGACDPGLGAAACPDALVCCAQGPVQVGAHRCASAVAGLDPDDPPASPDEPGNGALGCDAPDLAISEQFIMPVLTEIMVDQDSCLLYEGCVGGTGTRTILRFDLVTPNLGSRDLVLGVAANNPDIFHYSSCHDHYHFDEYAHYELLDGADVIGTGQKLGFCLLDSFSWAWPGENAHYDCANQGISRGWADIYESALPCQWIDVTDVPAGDYTLRATVNQARSDWAVPLLVERDYDNNTVFVPVTLP